ncbi:MAG: hypothetical protein ACRDXX_14815 [Stackebrandtia sp.]
MTMYSHHPGYGQQPPQGSGSGGGWITVEAKFFILAWILFFIKPKIFVDGQQMPDAKWERNTFSVAPGQHTVHCSTPFLWDWGKADLVVQVGPGQHTALEYRSPVFLFSPGSLGPPPQKYNGWLILGAIYGVGFLLMLCSCLFSALSAV